MRVVNGTARPPLATNNASIAIALAPAILSTILRLLSRSCAVRTQSSTPWIMTSPDVFRTSPRNASRRTSHSTGSSSPGLPPLQDLLSQKSPRPPPFKVSSRTEVGERNGCAASFQSARVLWKSAQAVDGLPVDLVANDHDTSASVIEVEAETVPKARKPSSKAKTAKGKGAPAEGTDASDERSWKKYKSMTRAQEDEGQKTESRKGAGYVDEAVAQNPTRKGVPKKTGLMSNHFNNTPEPRQTSKAPNAPADEPLFLEQALARRMDWTPPKEKLAVRTDPPLDPATVQDVTSSMDSEPRGVFKNLQAAFACDQAQPQPEPAVVISDEDSSFLRKRKLVEMVAVSNAKSETDAAEEAGQPGPKTKAPKKKARTITDLATSAYRPAAEPEPEPSAVPSAPILNAVVNEEDESKVDAEQPKGKGKGKAKAKAQPKAPRKPAKKKAPPKPVLHSPTTALKQTTAQDFVFGTSSQLVREESPTFLRDLQAAIRESNEMQDAVGLGLTVQNDSGADGARQSKLWDASARDADGDLFDISIIDLVNTSINSAKAIETDTAGKGGHNENVRSATQVQAAPDISEDPFADSLDIGLPAAGAPEGLDEDDSFFSSSQISVSTNVGKRASPLKAPLRDPADEVPIQKGNENAMQAPTAKASSTDYETFTDAQLSKKIAGFGFKPVKKRTAMIALLNQCQQSTASASQSGIRAASTLSTKKPKATDAAVASTPKPRGRPRKNSIEVAEAPSTSPTKAAEPAKKPRGRPRKISVTELTDSEPPSAPAVLESPKRPRGRPRRDSQSSSPAPIQEPPPSAQPSGSPRPRGRPKKSTPSPTRETLSKTKAGKKVAEAAPASPKTPKGKAAAFKAMVEIPDSESEEGSDIEAFPSSSPSQADSFPPGVDMSVPMEEDGDLSLMVGATEEDVDLFKYITLAVKAAPRTKDPLNPSWHEKMLMYDPIIIEDLAVWLNRGRLDKVGYDGEVKPEEVKKWCESNSVCCLSRINLRGKERKRN